MPHRPTTRADTFFRNTAAQDNAQGCYRCFVVIVVIATVVLVEVVYCIDSKSQQQQYK